jgi:hypothetical protein
MNKRVIITIVFFIIILIGTTSVIEFYYAKDAKRMPILALKSENKAKQYHKYSSLFYDVYKCYSGTVFAVSKTYPEPICSRIITYEDGYYTNINGLKILKKDFQAIYDISCNLGEIDNFTTKEEVEKAVLIASEYERNISIPIKTIQVNKQVVNINAFKDLSINGYGDYVWEYQRENESYYKCEKNGLYKEYSNDNCLGEWSELTYSKEWCEAASNSTGAIKETYNKYCK